MSNLCSWLFPQLVMACQLELQLGICGWKTTTVGRYGMDGKDLKTLTAEDFKSKMNHRQIFTSGDEILLSKYLLFIYILLKPLTLIQAIVSLHNMAINWSKNSPANWTKYRMGELIVRVRLWENIIILVPLNLRSGRYLSEITALAKRLLIIFILEHSSGIFKGNRFLVPHI